jgi:hypothetical protein
LAAQDERTAKDKSPGVNNRGHENAFKSGTPTDSSRFYLCRPQASFLGTSPFGRAKIQAMIIPYLCLALLQEPTPAERQPEVNLSESVQPTSPKEMAEVLGIKKIQLATAPGLELWCDDSKIMRIVQKPLLAAWEFGEEQLGHSPLRKGATIRIVLLKDEKAVRNYYNLLVAECKRWKLPAPAPSWADSVIASGSAHMTFPPTAVQFLRVVGKNEILTRSVHDLGVVRMASACSYSGFGVPPFLKEGFAGMLMKTLKKPSAIVSHKNAALESTIQGYGVFAGIGAAMNDASNAASNWPSVIKTAVDKMWKQKTFDPMERVDSILQRTDAEFARSDYAFSWAVCSFLFDAHYPFGEAATLALEDKRWKSPIKPLPQSRRTAFLLVLQNLRDFRLARVDADARGKLLRDYLLEEYGEEPNHLHRSFLHWTRTRMPK